MPAGSPAIYPAFVAADVPLASMTTLAVGGPCAGLLNPMTEEETAEAIRAARAAGDPITVLGGGSNVLIADAGIEGVVLQSADYTIDVQRSGPTVRIEAGAGVEWDELVAFCAAEGFAGIECLSGIPGKVGAAPVQNIGAYGQELSDTLRAVRTLDLETGAAEEVPAGDCGLGYRTSRFKGEWRGERFVSRVVLELRRGPADTPRYGELTSRLGLREGGPAPPVSLLRDAVLDIRRGKSMVYDESDPNHRSAGSFFTNPVVDDETLRAVYVAADGLGLDPNAVPRFDATGGTKLSAAWLIERAGFEKGFAFGAAGLSTKHCLAIVNHGRARAQDIVALAAIVRRGVRSTFGVTLDPEPIFLGFDLPTEELLG